MRKFLGIALALAIAPAAMAVDNSYSAGPGLNISVPDNLYDGTLGSMSSSTIVVPSVGADTITGLTVDVGMSHTWVGDLTIKLVSPSGSLLTLLNRPGIPDGPDDGSTCCGDSSNLSAANLITYDDAASTSAELLGAAQPSSNDIIPAGSYIPAPDGAAGLANLAGFIGENAVGTWTLYIGDGAGGDVGTLDFWRLNISTIPEPTSLALLGLGVLGLIRRR